jgi:hypothetical protein
MPRPRDHSRKSPSYGARNRVTALAIVDWLRRPFELPLPARLLLFQNANGLAFSTKRPKASKEGTACKLIDICSASPPGDRRWRISISRPGRRAVALVASISGCCAEFSRLDNVRLHQRAIANRINPVGSNDGCSNDARGSKGKERPADVSALPRASRPMVNRTEGETGYRFSFFPKQLWLIRKRRRALRQPAQVGRLLERVGVAEELRLGVIEAQQFSTDRHADWRSGGRGGEPARKSHGWKPGPVGQRAIALRWSSAVTRTGSILWSG